jgi:hypothetical protein
MKGVAPGVCCIAVKSSFPQGMIVCFNKRSWLVCRNSGDTEGCRESVMKRSQWREKLTWGLWIGVLRQERDTDGERDADIERKGMLIQRERGCRCRAM